MDINKALDKMERSVKSILGDGYATTIKEINECLNELVLSTVSEVELIEESIRLTMLFVSNVNSIIAGIPINVQTVEK